MTLYVKYSVSASINVQFGASKSNYLLKLLWIFYIRIANSLQALTCTPQDIKQTIQHIKTWPQLD